MSAQDDLDYMREMAEKGASAPLGGGGVFLWWAATITAALFLHHLIAVGALFEPGWSYLILWVAAIAAGWAGMFAIIGRARADGGTVTHAMRTQNAVWMAAGLFLTFFAFAIVARQVTQPLGVHVFDLMIAVGTGVYGIAFATTASVSGKRWLWLFALLAFGFSGVYVFLLGTPQIYLFAAAGTAVVAGLPGVILLRAK